MMRDQAIRNTHPSVQMIKEERWAFDAAGNPVVIDESLVATEIARLQVDYAATQYQRDRAKAYPDFRDYLDGLVKNDQAQINKYLADCAAVKAKYPKPE